MRLPPARTQRCVRCGRQASNWHHRLNRSRGGLNDPFNLIPLCGDGTRGCHGLITGNPQLARDEGWTVTGYMTRGRYVGSDPAYQKHYNGVEVAA